MSDSPFSPDLDSFQVFQDVLKDEYGTRRTFSSFRNSTLTAENTASFMSCCNYLPLIHPYGPFRHFIDFIITIALIYTCINVPVTLAFNADLHDSSLRITDLCIDILLLFDVMINFRTAYFDKFDRLTLVRDPYEIAKRYFTSWFFIDLIASLPFQLIASSDNYIIFGLLRCLKILRLIKMVRIYNKFKKTIVSRNIKSFIKLAKLLLSMILFAHFAACFWYFIGYHNTGANGTHKTWIDDKGLRDADLSTFKLYSFAWYWAVVTLFTTGYGDITATNTLEQWVSSILILIGTCFFSYFIGTLTVLITEGDKEASYTLDRLEEAQNFCIHKKLPTELARAILTHTQYYCENNYVFDEESTVNILPLHLQLQIEYYLSSHFIKQIRIFKSLNDSILGQIALKIRSVSCNATHALYHRGQRAKEIYIQRTGLAELNYHDSRRKPKTLTRGEVFGEDAFTIPKRRSSVTCKTWCEFYVIPIVEVINILQNEYPKSYLNKLRIIIDGVRSKTQQQQKIDFRKYRSEKSEKSETDDAEKDVLENFLNQTPTDLGIRLQSRDSNMSRSNHQREETKKKVKKAALAATDIKRKQSQLQLWTSKFELFRNSSTFRDRVARRQLTKRRLRLFNTKSKENDGDLDPQLQKTDDLHRDFYAGGDIETDMSLNTDEDIEDIVPGLALVTESTKEAHATNEDSFSVISLQLSPALKKPQYGGGNTKRLGMKGRRHKIGKNMMGNKGNKSLRRILQKSGSARDIYTAAAHKENEHEDHHHHNEQKEEEEEERKMQIVYIEKKENDDDDDDGDDGDGDDGDDDKQLNIAALKVVFTSAENEIKKVTNPEINTTP